MNLSLRKEKSHEAHRQRLSRLGTERQPEELDLVILGGVAGLDATFAILAPEN